MRVAAAGDILPEPEDGKESNELSIQMYFNSSSAVSPAMKCIRLFLPKDSMLRVYPKLKTLICHFHLWRCNAPVSTQHVVYCPPITTAHKQSNPFGSVCQLQSCSLHFLWAVRRKQGGGGGRVPNGGMHSK